MWKPSVYMGVVENRLDPMKLGRCQVRVMGLHTADKIILPTDMLPWAIPMQSINSAAMNGIGQSPVGLVPGTWVLVIFQDEDCQQPIMIGSIGGIPDTNTITSTGDDDVVVIRDPLTGDASEQISTTNVRGDSIKTIGDVKVEPPKPKEYAGGGAPNTDLPKASPPPSYTTNRGLRSNGIQAIIIACKEQGFNDKNAIAAILGIVGGECEWIPKSEGYKFKDPARMVKIFSAFKGDIALASQYAVGGVHSNPDDFFEMVYGYTSKKGKELGNKSPGDGKKYSGKGFVQMTGLTNYKKMAELAKVDIVNNPEILNTDQVVSAKVAVAFIKRGLQGKNIPQNDPGFFLAAAKVINGEHLITEKRKLYEYFLGQDTGANEKCAAPEDIKQLDTPAASTGATALPGGDRTHNIVLGFSDPQGKYPLRSHLHEPDTNRLARGIDRGTIATKKTGQRTTAIPRPFEGSFDQPATPYSAAYPYNKVFESESGHVMEFDDTPKYERVMIAHRTGTFTEIDANGTQVNKIVGDNFIIMERNGCVFVRGECNITTDGNINILCNSTANIEIMGNANVDVRSDANISVNNDVELGVGRNVTAKVGGNVTAEIDGWVDALVKGDVTAHILGNVNAKIAKNVLLDVTGSFDLRCGGAFRIQAATASIKTSGTSAIDGSQIHLNSGVATAATGALDIKGSSTKAMSDVWICEPGDVKGAEIAYITPPPPALVDELEIGETPDEISPEAAAKMDSQIAGDKSTPANTSATDSSVIQPNNAGIVVTNCDLILNMESFQHSFVLSPASNITIGTLLACPGNCSEPQDTIVADSKVGIAYRISKQEIVCNMKQVAINILENVYVVAGGKNSIIVSSSFRLPGSNNTSDHNKGRAIDIQIQGKNYDCQAHFDLINKLSAVLPYDQLILEYRDPKAGSIGPRKVWIHISYRGIQNRKMAFTMLNDATYHRDLNGQPSGFYLL